MYRYFLFLNVTSLACVWPLGWSPGEAGSINMYESDMSCFIRDNAVFGGTAACSWLLPANAMRGSHNIFIGYCSYRKRFFYDFLPNNLVGNGSLFVLEWEKKKYFYNITRNRWGMNDFTHNSMEYKGLDFGVAFVTEYPKKKQVVIKNVQ